MAEPQSKKAKLEPSYCLLYHPQIPGRGEFIRLFFEASSTPYTEAAPDVTYAHCKSDSLGMDGNPPQLWPRMLKVQGLADGTMLMAQTANIVMYLGENIGLNGTGRDKWHVNALALTALDLNDEVHDSHHPIASGLYYEDQKDEALRRSMDFRSNRLPKYFGYFERVLKGNLDKGKGKFLIGDELSYADLCVWQMLHGLKYAFPKEMAAREEDYELLFGTFFDSIQQIKEIKSYLESDRRQAYSMGVFRHYPELDRE